MIESTDADVVALSTKLGDTFKDSAVDFAKGWWVGSDARAIRKRIHEKTTV